jgi:hypothetical protein
MRLAEMRLAEMFDDGHQHIHGHSDPHLRSHRVLRCVVELFDMKVLFYPFEEKLDLPAASIESGNGVRSCWSGRSTVRRYSDL